MTDLIFGELEEDGYHLRGKLKLDFGGIEYPVELWIEVDEEDVQISQKQHEAYKAFMEKWSDLQPKLIKALINYYNEEERFAWGPDDEDEMDKWWPEIETDEALLKAVTIEAIVIRMESIMDIVGGRNIYLLFSRAWGGEDWDDNGIGVGFVNEEIHEIAYKDIAY